MSVDGNTCRVRRETGLSAQCARGNKVKSLASVFQCAPDTVKNGSAVDDLVSLKERFLAPLVVVTRSETHRPALTRRPLSEELMTEQPIEVVYASPPVRVPQKLHCCPENTKARTCLTDVTHSHKDGDKSAVPSVCETSAAAVSCTQKLSVPEYGHHGVPSVNRDPTLNPDSESDESVSPKSSPCYSNSPSPVRSTVASPFAAATLKQTPCVDNKDGFSSKSHRFSAINISYYPLSTPFDNHTQDTQCKTVPEVCRSKTSRVTLAADEVCYPKCLNPFDSCEQDDLDEMHEVGLTRKEPSLNHKNCAADAHTGVSGHEHSLEVRESYSFSSLPNTSVPTSLCAPSSDSVRFSRPGKKSAPLPPISLSTANHSKLRVSAPVDVTTASSHDPLATLSTVSSANHRASSADTPREHEAPYVMETRSMIMKRQAPPLPIPGRRIIKGDPSEICMSYSEIHERLYTANKHIAELERQARRLQMQITQAHESSGNINALLKEWSSIVEQKEKFCKIQSDLVRRLRRQELEERHATLEHEFRQLWAKQDILKTNEEKAREKYLMAELIKTVNERDELVDPTDDFTESVTSVEPRKLRKFMCLNAPRSKKEKESEAAKHRHSFGLFFKRIKARRKSSTEVDNF
ncbi:MICAL-like protein 2 [Clonorchis sinensis]|uniref:MICAL-like protein 2 n=1 Tax=Clonorchis sinensis TaxID=79923 RepID=A0A8T1MAG7_CLOSI|nr:MICAL-like protein 2 [Clonorchis sinensis]